jgi:hypothetical protein
MRKIARTCALLTIVATVAHAQIDVPRPRVTPPSEVKPGSGLDPASLDEKGKRTAREIARSRVYPLGAEIRYLVEPSRPSLGPNRAQAFCAGRADETPWVVVQMPYEWRPDDSHVQDAYLIVRTSGDEIRAPVRLGPGKGIAEAGRPTGGPLTGLFSLSKADICPTGCTEARLAPRTAADANRFDQRWQRACLR